MPIQFDRTQTARQRSANYIHKLQHDAQQTARTNTNNQFRIA